MRSEQRGGECHAWGAKGLESEPRSPGTRRTHYVFTDASRPSSVGMVPASWLTQKLLWHGVAIARSKAKGQPLREARQERCRLQRGTACSCTGGAHISVIPVSRPISVGRLLVSLLKVRSL